MTQRKADSIRKRLPNMTRKQLQETFILFYGAEMEHINYKDLAIATDSRIRSLIMSALYQFEYLAK